LTDNLFVDFLLTIRLKVLLPIDPVLSKMLYAIKLDKFYFFSNGISLSCYN